MHTPSTANRAGKEPVEADKPVEKGRKAYIQNHYEASKSKEKNDIRGMKVRI